MNITRQFTGAFISIDPLHIYTQRLQQCQLQVKNLDNTHRRLAWMRLLLATIFIVGIFCYPGIWMLVPTSLFLYLMRQHAHIQARLQTGQRSIEFYNQGLARIAGNWSDQGPKGTDFLDPQHAYARDLDIFGPHSLYQLICRARTRSGQERLADWLCHPADAETVISRQIAAQELREALDLRQQLYTLTPAYHHLNALTLETWASSPLAISSLPAQLLALLLGLMGLTSLIYWLWSYNPLPLLLMLVIELVFMQTIGKRVSTVLKATESIRAECLVLGAYLQRLESERFNSLWLQKQWQPLLQYPSGALSHLERLLDALEWRHNPLLAPLFFILLLPYQLTTRVETWRSGYASKIPEWVESIAQIEAILCLSAYAWENPEYSWPEILPAGSGLEILQARHPLLGPTCIANDIDLISSKLWIISGSNMSGKSSLLRTLGSNVVLAMMGAPVAAKAMRLEPLRLAASIQLSDSLSGGISRFYAEILRLRQVFTEALNPPRLLYLLDEILGGTNSQDRLLGAQAIIKQLYQQNNLGLVTTHDLALTELVTELGSDARNWHFQDQLTNGVMSFDYSLRPGVVQHSNALELMRSLGLKV